MRNESRPALERGPEKAKGGEYEGGHHNEPIEVGQGEFLGQEYLLTVEADGTERRFDQRGPWPPGAFLVHNDGHGFEVCHYHDHDGVAAPAGAGWELVR